MVGRLIGQLRTWVHTVTAPRAPRPAPERPSRRTRRLNEARDNDEGWRPIRLSRDVRRDLTPCRHDRMVQLAQLQWRENPIAKRAISNMRSFVASEGFLCQALSDNEEYRNRVQKVIDQHWELCGWDKRLTQRVETLAVEGEWIYYVPPPNRFSGQFKLGKILPELVDGFERNPMDAEELRTIRFVQQLQVERDGEIVPTRQLDVVRRDPDGKLRGEVLYLGINMLSGQTRGYSDLMPVIDLLDQLDTLIYTETERVQFQRAFAWFVEVMAEGDALDKKKEDLLAEGPPRPGQLLVHSPTEKWDTKSTNLNLSDSVQFLKFVMMICFGGLFMPEHYYAEGGDVNKATSANMTPPIFAWVRDRKRAIKDFIELGVELVIQRAVECGALAGIPAEHLRWEVVSRDAERTAYDVIGASLRTLGEALAQAIEMGFVNEVEATRIYRKAATDQGLGDLPLVPELEQAKTLDQARKGVVVALDSRRPQLEQYGTLDARRAA